MIETIQSFSKNQHVIHDRGHTQNHTTLLLNEI